MKLHVKLPDIYISILRQPSKNVVAFIDSTDVEAKVVTLRKALASVFRLVVVVQTVRTNYLHSSWHHRLFLNDVVLHKFSHYLRTMLP